MSVRYEDDGHEAVDTFNGWNMDDGLVIDVLSGRHAVDVLHQLIIPAADVVYVLYLCGLWLCVQESRLGDEFLAVLEGQFEETFVVHACEDGCGLEYLLFLRYL